jgi:GntR family transcriptional repressor for pyruvate dehydrogenase complex
VTVSETEFGRSAPDDIVTLLRAQIHGGELGPGDRLPNERDLAARLGVSRLTLRQALRTLIGEGYLTSKRGNSGGTFVTDLAQPQLVWLDHARRRPEWIVDLLDFRKAIETRTAMLAAQRASADHLTELRRAVDASAEPTSRGVFRQADHLFHLALADASGSPRLREAMLRARGELFVPVDAVAYEDRFRQTFDEHSAILKAVVERDARSAAAAMEAHLDSSLRDLLHVVGDPPLPKGSFAGRD